MCVPCFRKLDVPVEDLSFLSVGLYTTAGVFKTGAEVAPFGSYDVPLYDDGEYDLRVTGREGWTFGVRPPP
jgi:BOS complex subunit NOMO1-like protein